MKVTSWNGFRNYHFLFMKCIKTETYHLRAVVNANSILGCSEMDSGDANIRKKNHAIAVTILISHREQ